MAWASPLIPLKTMADDILDLEQLDNEIESTSKVEKRIKDLSEKVRLTAEERDAEKRKAEEESAKTSGLQKEVEFLNSFGDQLSKHPEASPFRDKIKEKVLKGYSIEDATISTLASEGKLTQAEVQVDNVAGGSATVNQPITGEQKKVSEMSRDEKRAKLIEAEQRGDISLR